MVVFFCYEPVSHIDNSYNLSHNNNAYFGWDVGMTYYNGIAESPTAKNYDKAIKALKEVGMKVHFSSLRLDWKTPKAVYQVLDAEFNFDFDPCPTNPQFDGLNIDWGKRCFCNPPYGREIPKWVEKAWVSVHGRFNADDEPTSDIVVLLVPSRTDTRWWHEYIMKANEIRFIKGRLKFDDSKNSAPFPSAIVVFK